MNNHDPHRRFEAVSIDKPSIPMTEQYRFTIAYVLYRTTAMLHIITGTVIICAKADSEFGEEGKSQEETLWLYLTTTENQEVMVCINLLLLASPHLQKPLYITPFPKIGH